ncbi:MAG: UDP-N-acetylmuramate dehydrogenase [Pseudomonadota bacterium]|nr:UDP-N-acetylmuramate dehydrogenase [Burkholderiaceae bacterium]MDQ3447308.1 UDP-N-acetylmuramate dehydrogenase [Pseudomonadota bacterium]
MKVLAERLIERDVSLRPFNTFGVDANAALYARIRSLEDLQRVLADRRVLGMPLLILGGGSNVLFTQDFDGCVLKVEISGVQRADDGVRWRVQVGAGENWHALVERLLDDGVPGLENLALIPGSVGAAPIQNIGAYGVELAERFHSLQAWNFATQTLQTLTADECRFGYRDSAFKHETEPRLIVNVTFALPRQWAPVVGYTDVENELRERNIQQPRPRDVFDAVVSIRRRKLPDPARVGNAGSFFKNPVISRAQRSALIERHPSLVSYDIGGGRYKLAAGWLIDACGLKGTVRGRAAVYDKQALVLVNLGGASGADILALAREVQEAVLARFNIELEPEPRIL